MAHPIDEELLGVKYFEAGTSFATRDDAKRIIKDQLQSNYSRIQSGKQDPKFTPLTQDLKQLEVRSGVPKKFTIEDEPDNTFKATHATATAKGDQQNIGLKGQPVATKTHKDLPGVNLTPEEFRKYSSTGMYKGKFVNPEVLQQVKELDETGKWPVDPITGNPRSLKGFRRELNRGWDVIAAQEANLDTKRTGWVHQRGHGVSAEDGGANWKDNVASQPATAIEKGGDIGVGNLSPNISQGKKTLKNIDDLEMAGLEGATVSKAFNAYLMEGTEGIQNLRRFTPRQKSTIMHDPNISAEGAAWEAELQNRRIANRNEIKAANPVKTVSLADQAKANILAKNPLIPDVRLVKGPAGYFDKIKNHLTSQGFAREAARVAGQSNVPWTNIAGDFVGVVFDGLAVAANPKDKKAIMELVMSGSQLATSTVGSALIAIPDPLTGGLGMIIMKAGDKVGQLERMWNMSREGINYARKQIKKGDLIENTTKKGKMIQDIGDDIKLDSKSVGKSAYGF